MIRRTTEQWLALFDQYKASGLTQTEFAKQQGIDPTYFSYRKRQLLAWQQDDNTGFVELTPQGMLLSQPMLLKKRDVELLLPSGTD
ncbi:IS66 family insertion sequence element accessory protein TnpA, partial [Rheinheimera baltica]